MKIAHIAPPWIAIPTKNYGGTENVISYLVEEQVAQGHEVTLFAPASTRTSARVISFIPRALLDEDVPWAAHLKAYYHLHRSIEQAQKMDFDLVHMHLSSSSDMYILPLSASLTVPHVTTLHSHFPFDHVGNWQGDADNYYMKWAPMSPVIAISESARKTESAYPLNFIGVVYNGISMQEYKPTTWKTADYFVWVGRFSPVKGTHLAIEAAKKAGVPLVLGGTIDRSSQQGRDYFYQQIKPHVDQHQIRYIGPVDTKRKLRLLSQARAFLNPIQWEEPFGMVMIEAMALGCPVISFARGAASEIIKHGESGFLVQSLDEMVHYIDKINEIDRHQTRTLVEQHFSARTMAEHYLHYYQKAISLHQSQLTQKPEEDGLTV